MTQYPFLDGQRLRKAHSVRRIAPIFERLATRLARIPELRYIKLFPERISASNVLSTDGRKNPLVQIGAGDIVGVELLVDTASRVVQFYAITSAVRGCGRRIVEAVLSAVPEDWQVVVVWDASGGFWQRMVQIYPRLVLF